MNPLLKLHLGSAAYCALLSGLNWFRSIEYARTQGVTREVLSPVLYAELLSGVWALWLGLHCLRAARLRLETGRKVAPGTWIQSRSVLLYALPLLWHQQTTSNWVASDGAIATQTGGYGHDLSLQVFLFAVVGLLLFQILMRLLSDDPDQYSGGRTGILSSALKT